MLSKAVLSVMVLLLSKAVLLLNKMVLLLSETVLSKAVLESDISGVAMAGSLEASPPLKEQRAPLPGN